MLHARALLFYIDGTVLDTRELIIQATEHALSSCGYPVPERLHTAREVGKPIEEFYRNLSGFADVDPFITPHRAFGYSNLNLSVPFPNSVKTLSALQERGFKIGAVTSRSHTSVETLKRAGAADFFGVVISPDDTPVHKPEPTPLFMALKVLGERPGEAVMIGDSDLDVQAGKNAGMKTIRARYGFHSDNLHNPEPDAIIGDISELLNLLVFAEEG